MTGPAPSGAAPAGALPAGTITAHFAGRQGGFTLDAAFTAPARGITALFGPSGCGKTTVLRAIAGLWRPARGRFELGCEVWQDPTRFWPTHRRPIGYVFQEASLFPHLSIADNLHYGRRRALAQGTAETIRFDEVVGLLDLERLLGRWPQFLSGGERQRVALGRALLSQPKLLLLDEPLAALDRVSKEEILPYLEALHDSLSIPAVYVSHDLAEVERLADHLVILADGRVVAAGPMAVLQADVTLPIARLPEAGVTLAATVTGYDRHYGLTTLAVAGGTLLVPGQRGPAGARRRARIAASDVSLARRRPEDSTILNALPGRITAAVVQDEAQINVVVRLGDAAASGEVRGEVRGEAPGDPAGGAVLARVTRKSWDQLGLAIGDRVYAQVKSIALVNSGVGSGVGTGDSSA